VLRIGRDAGTHQGWRRIPESEQHVEFLPWTFRCRLYARPDAI